jgi:predicted  nucleic acid-binding Zn-ribbon protein
LTLRAGPDFGSGGSDLRRERLDVAAAIPTRMLEAQVWARVEEVLANPQVIANELARLHDADPTGTNIAALNKRIAEVERQRTDLMRRLATIDDDDVAAPFLVQIQTLGTQHKQLQRERDNVEAERRGWQLAQERLDDI